MTCWLVGCLILLWDHNSIYSRIDPDSTRLFRGVVMPVHLCGVKSGIVGDPFPCLSHHSDNVLHGYIRICGDPLQRGGSRGIRNRFPNRDIQKVLGETRRLGVVCVILKRGNLVGSQDVGEVEGDSGSALCGHS